MDQIRGTQADFMQDPSAQTQRMLDFYGLAHNPFSETVDATVFSGAGERSETVEQLKHLLTFSPQDCLVMAPHGAGKRTLAQEVLKRLDDDWKVAWIDGGETQSLDAVTRELIGQLGLGLKADGDTASVYRTMADVIDQRTYDGENFLLIVEHADRLSADVQHWLQSLHSLSGRVDNRLRQLWLAATATAVEGADNDDQWYITVLEPFSDEDALVYLKDRFAGAGHSAGVPIEPKDVNRLNRMASGVPGELNQVAQDYLIAGTFKTAERHQGFPLTHVLAGAAVVTLIVVSVLYGSQSDPEPTESAAVGEQASDTGDAVSDVQRRLAEAAARVESRRKESDDADERTSAGAASESPESAAPRPAAEPEQPAEPDPAPSPAQPEVAEVAPATPAPSTEAAAAESWFSSAPDSHYTLQLLGVRDRRSVEQMVAGLTTPDRYRIVETTLDGRPWYVLVHGQYQDAAAARGDIASLPEAFEGQSPWPRTFASLRASMR